MPAKRDPPPIRGRTRPARRAAPRRAETEGRHDQRLPSRSLTEQSLDATEHACAYRPAPRLSPAIASSHAVSRRPSARHGRMPQAVGQSSLAVFRRLPKPRASLSSRRVRMIRGEHGGGGRHIPRGQPKRRRVPAIAWFRGAFSSTISSISCCRRCFCCEGGARHRLCRIGFALDRQSIVGVAAAMPVGYLVDRSARAACCAGLLIAGLPISVSAWPRPIRRAAGDGVRRLANSVFHPADYALLSAKIAPVRLGRAFSIHTLRRVLGNAGRAGHDDRAGRQMG